MRTNQSHGAIGFMVVSVLVGCLMISGCNPGQPFGPTPTPTLIPTPTPDPMAKSLDDANSSWSTGFVEKAISQYKSILEQSTDTSIRTTIFHALEQIGAYPNKDAIQNWYPGNTKAGGNSECDIYALKQSAYALILKAQDRPTFQQDHFYIDAAKMDVLLSDCDTGGYKPIKSFTEDIHSLLDGLTIYPNEPAVMDILKPAILRTFLNEINTEYQTKYQDILSNWQSINTAMGDYPYNGETASAWFNSDLLQKDLCSGNPLQSTNVGTSAMKKIYSCVGGATDTALEKATLSSADSSEIWYILEYESTDSGLVHCTGYRTDKGTTFSYTYASQTKEVYSLKDVHTGKVLASKTFTGTAPKCVFTSCSLNTLTNTATCTGGEGSSTYDEATLIQWLRGRVK